MADEDGPDTADAPTRRQQRADRLLGGGRLGGPTREAVLARVLDQVAAPGAPAQAERGPGAAAPAVVPAGQPWRERWRRWWLPVLSPVAAAAALLLVLQLRAPGDRPGSDAAGTAGLSARGAPRPETRTAHLELRCKGGERGRCALGGTLLFHLHLERDLGPGPLWLAARAEPVPPAGRQGPEGGRIWYFPDGKGELVELDGRAGPHLLRRGIELGPEHHPGPYRIRFWLLRAPTDRRTLEQEAAPLVAGGEAFLQVTP